MREQAVALGDNLRVWQDERMGQLWRLAYYDGLDEQLITFPDAEALGDFLTEQLGLNLEDALEAEMA